MNANDEIQLEIEDLIRRVLKSDGDPVTIDRTLAAADPAIRAEVVREFRENQLLRRSFESTATIFDELIRA